MRSQVTAALMCLSLCVGPAKAQSVPNGTITSGTIWTPSQWTTAWTSKQNTLGPGSITAAMLASGAAAPNLTSVQAVALLSGQIVSGGFSVTGGLHADMLFVTSGTGTPTYSACLTSGAQVIAVAGLCSGAYLPLTGGALSGPLTVSAGGATVTGGTTTDTLNVTGVLMGGAYTSITPTSCGTAPSGSGSPSRGYIQTGSTPVTSCTVPLPAAGSAYPNGAACIANTINGAVAMGVNSTSGNSNLVTFTFASSVTSRFFQYICFD